MADGNTPIHTPNPATWYLDKALDRQSDRLFTAESIIQCVASSIEDRLRAEIDKLDSRIPNYPRALRQAAELIQSAYCNLEIASLEPIAEDIEKAEREALEQGEEENG